jgi:hypothetical protein
MYVVCMYVCRDKNKWRTGRKIRGGLGRRPSTGPDERL